jgi:hypothetical protein
MTQSRRGSLQRPGSHTKHEAGPEKIDLRSSVNVSGWPLSRVFNSGSLELVSDLSSRFGQLPGGLWPECPETALIVPIISGGQSRGFLVAGFSARRIIDADYRSFFDLMLATFPRLSPMPRHMRWNENALKHYWLSTGRRLNFSRM